MSARATDLSRLSFYPVDHSRWGDFERLFEAKGSPKYCWCMVWRAHGKEARNTDGSFRKKAMKARVEADVPIGLLGYLEDEPVAWCSIAPRNTYRPLGGVDDPEESDDRVWSLVCFFVKRKLRKQGMTEVLIKAAIDYARTKGAHVVEAYPVEPDSPSYRFMGFVPTFERLGFRYCHDAGTRRKVMRLDLGTKK